MAKLRWLATVPAVTAPAVYTVTGANSVDNVQALLTIEVAALAVPPAGLAYVDPQGERARQMREAGWISDSSELAP